MPLWQRDAGRRAAHSHRPGTETRLVPCGSSGRYVHTGSTAGSYAGDLLPYNTRGTKGQDRGSAGNLRFSCQLKSATPTKESLWPIEPSSCVGQFVFGLSRTARTLTGRTALISRLASLGSWG